MNENALNNSLLADALLPVRQNTLLRNIFLAVAGSLLLYASAKVKIPFIPVPMTMQTFAVLVIGMAYGWKLGGATLLLYLAEGASGLPVFTSTPEKGIGVAYMMGPTGGYLAGFFLAAVLVGWLAEKGWDKRVSTTALAMLLGNIVIYIPGLIWLGMLMGWDKPILDWGLIPFIPADLLKLALAAVTLPMLWKLARRG